MFTIRKKITFEASHQLLHHDGKCARLHGHSWIAWIEMRSPIIEDDGPKTGMVIDYGDIKAAAKPLLENHLDHHHLNDTLFDDDDPESERVAEHSPTSEVVARWIYDQLAPVLGAELRAVEVEETCTASCRYSPFE